MMEVDPGLARYRTGRSSPDSRLTFACLHRGHWLVRMDGRTTQSSFTREFRTKAIGRASESLGSGRDVGIPAPPSPTIQIEVARRDAECRVQGDPAPAAPLAGVRGRPPDGGGGRPDPARRADGLGRRADGSLRDDLPVLVASASERQLEAVRKAGLIAVEVEPTEAAITERITPGPDRGRRQRPAPGRRPRRRGLLGLRGRGARLDHRRPPGRAPRTAHLARPPGAGDLRPVRDAQGGRRRRRRDRPRGARGEGRRHA